MLVNLSVFSWNHKKQRVRNAKTKSIGCFLEKMWDAEVFYNFLQPSEYEKIASQLLVQATLKNANYMKQFSALKTDLEKLNFVYKDLKKYQLFPKYKRGGKDALASVKYKELGNNLLRKEMYYPALRVFTKCISSAKNPSVLANAYADRAECLFMLEKYKECLMDINRAISHDCPNNLKEKLIIRRQKVERILRTTKPYHAPIPKIPNSRKNSHIQCAKNCIEIKSDEKYGRHVVATRDINIGEIICVEKPFACILDRALELHCHECLELCYNPIPCQNCTQLVFCTEECRERARNTYHKYECPIIEAVNSLDVDAAVRLALRVTILAKDEDLNLLNSSLEMYRSDRYKEVHNLLRVGQISEMSLFHFITAAAILYHFMQKTDYFATNSDRMKDKFKEILLLHIQICHINVINIYEVVPTLSENKDRIYGMGLYPFCGLFNHSCSSNVDCVHYGSTTVLRALNTIKKGQQCFISYGLQYEDVSKEVRQSFFKKCFFFDCKCTACEKDWTVEDDLIPFKFPLALDLDMSQLEVNIMQTALSTGDEDTAAKFFPRLVQRFRRHERHEPWGNALQIKNLIRRYFRVFSNRTD